MHKWARRFLGLAQNVATWSRDPSTKVGACIVDINKRIISVGFNGLPQHVRDDNIESMSRDERLRRTIHAEDNAILFAQRPLDGCTIYITHAPCARCAGKIIQSGIRSVIVPSPASPEFAERWAEDYASAAEMFKDAGIRVTYLAPEEKS